MKTPHIIAGAVLIKTLATVAASALFTTGWRICSLSITIDKLL